MPIVGLDYFFLTNHGVLNRNDLGFDPPADGDVKLEAARTNGDVAKYLLVRCFQTKAIFAHLVPQKGLDEHNVACDFVLGDLEWLGHSRVIINADNGPAAQALVNRVVELAKIECKGFEQLSPEQPAAYDSQSNGGTEVGVRRV